MQICIVHPKRTSKKAGSAGGSSPQPTGKLYVDVGFSLFAHQLTSHLAHINWRSQQLLRQEEESPKHMRTQNDSCAQVISDPKMLQKISRAEHYVKNLGKT